MNKKRKAPAGAAPVVEPGTVQTSIQGLVKSEPVRFIAGPFAGFDGEVSKVLNRSEVAVSVLFMGKQTTKVSHESDLERV